VTDSAARIRVTSAVHGVVQGVGFRPALYRLAVAHGLAGWIRNRPDAVELVLEGAAQAVAACLAALPGALPPRARVAAVTEVERRPVAPAEALRDFTIRRGAPDASGNLVIPADLALCPACRAELDNPADRRWAYPFTTCTDCGPRYTVVRALPYDRERTTMAPFTLCADCAREYADPADRRFHAETLACPACGPTLRYLGPGMPPREGPAALAAARAALAAGHILAVKGIGGFQLAVDATNRSAVARLRARKMRPHKPLAVMAADIETAARYAVVDAAARALLSGPEAPIVILDLRDPPPPGAALDLLAPDTRTLGLMLPTSPLHHLLFHGGAGTERRFELLVMTSGNRRGEPICTTDADAQRALGAIADAYLTHDRVIDARNDDSVCVIRRGAPQVWRRGRGFAPSPLPLPVPLRRPALGIGGDIKNAFALAYGRTLVLAPHVGDLDYIDTVDALRDAVERLMRFLNRRPEALGLDCHPDMAGTRLGRRMARELGIPTVAVQHHVAHAVACLAEHGLETGLALAFDGTGYGTDGAMWGAELLEIRPDGFRRLATFAAAPLPGGDAATLDPVRQLVARFAHAGLEPSAAWMRRLGISAAEWDAWARQAARGINTLYTHSAGRVLDSVCVALGLAPRPVTYEGQPPIRLEQAARAAAAACALPGAPFTLSEQADMLHVDWTPLFEALYRAQPSPDAAPAWARAVHSAVVDAAWKMVEYGMARSPVRAVALTGGVFMNRVLTDWTAERLERSGLRVLLHRETPPNDGCIAAGQAIMAGR
jgi:hydrogenase maturation protein HypF